MSELKATTAQEIVQNEKDCDYMDELFGGVKMPPTQVYLKSDVDKVIAHNKYKRCLLIAKWCFEKSYSTTLVKYDKESGYRLNFYDWWGNRWLELAEKFKEVK